MSNIITYPTGEDRYVGREFVVGATTKVWDGSKWVNKSFGNHEKRLQKNRQAIEAIYKSQGYTNVFFFEDGFTYAEPSDVGIYEDGTAWTYADAGSLPVTVAAGTIPSTPNYIELKLSKVFSSFIYNDIAFASDNYELMINAINSGMSLVFTDDIYIAPSGSTVEKSVSMSCDNGAKINWVGSGAVLKLKDGLSVSDSSVNHVVQSGDVVTYIDYEDTDGKLHSLSIDDFSVDGDFYFANLTTGLNLDPSVSDFGLSKLSITNGFINNHSVPFALINSTPYEIVSVSNITCKNKKSLVLSLPVQNFHPYYLNCQKSMKNVFIDGVDITNDRGFIADSDFTYSGIVLWEGNKLTMSNTMCTEIVTAGDSVYDVYMAGLDAKISNNKMLNCWSFNSSTNTGVKLKKCVNVTADKKTLAFDDGFFDYYETNNSLLLSSSTGVPFSLDMEGNTQGGSYKLSNLDITIPRAPSSGTNKATQELASFELINSVINVESGGGAYLVVPKWTAEMPDVPKYIKIKGNTITTNTTGSYYVAKMTINYGTSDGGAIDISDNDIVSNGGGLVSDILFLTDDTPARETKLDSLHLSNRIYTNGSYQQFKDFCSCPFFSRVELDYDVSSNSNQLSYVNITPSFDTSLTATVKNTNSGDEKRLGLLMVTKTANSNIKDCNVAIKGTFFDDNGLKDLSATLKISPNNTAGTVDFTFKVVDGGEQTITWIGSSSNTQSVDIGYDFTEPMQLVLKRYDDFAKLFLQYKDGLEPQFSTVNLNVSMT